MLMELWGILWYTYGTALLQFLELEGSVSNDMSYVISKGSCQLIFKEWHRICDDVVAGVCMRNEIHCFWQAL